MTVLASASGTRIDCVDCGEHLSSAGVTLDELRTASGYVRPEGQDCDFCPRCAQELFGQASR